MEAIIDSMKGSLDKLVHAPVLVVLWPAMSILCIVLHKTPMPNWLVQCIVVMLPALLVCFAVPITLKEYQEMWNPVGAHVVRCLSIGLVLGYVASRTCRPMTKLLEKLFPGFEGDTKFIYKQKDP